MKGCSHARRDRHTEGNTHGGDIHTEKTYTEGTTHRTGHMFLCRYLSTARSLAKLKSHIFTRVSNVYCNVVDIVISRLNFSVISGNFANSAKCQGISALEYKQNLNHGVEILVGDTFCVNQATEQVVITFSVYEYGCGLLNEPC